MESDLTYKPIETNRGLDTVRARAKKQKSVTLSRSVDNECQLPRASHEKIRSLKSLASQVEEELAELETADAGIMARIWDWFQRSIGNR